MTRHGTSQHPQVNGVLVPDLKARVEEQEKWKRARERTAKQLGGLWAAAGGMIVDRYGLVPERGGAWLRG